MGRPIYMELKDVSHPFMTVILTSVTMVGWADVPDSDWGDFRRQRAVDISSWKYSIVYFIYQKFKIIYFLMGPGDPQTMILMGLRALGMGPIIDVCVPWKF